MRAAQSFPAMSHCAPHQAPLLAAASTAAQSPGRHTHSQPRERPSMEDLPTDVLEAILGLVDRETLCTARLASKPLCTAASTHICSLTFRKPFQAVSCRRFPRLSRVTVDHEMKWGKLEQVDPSLRDLITTLEIRASTLEDCQVYFSRTVPQIALMPKLRELDVSLLEDLWPREFDVAAMVGVLCHCTNLEIFRLTAPTHNASRPMTFASMTSLTELHIIPTKYQMGYWGPDASWLEQATALKNLRALSIATLSEDLPLIGNLTSLTALSWVEFSLWNSAYSIHPLTRLTKLKSLRLQATCGNHEMPDSNVDIACSLGLGSLANLELKASDSCGKFLSRQTALTGLSLDGKLCNLRHIGALRLDVLQSLDLRSLISVDDEGLSLLRKATSLTHLSISTSRFIDRPEHGLLRLPLSQALAGLTQLRSLVLSPATSFHIEFLDYALALQPLTGLTQLKLSNAWLDKGGFRALLNLTGLRVLDLAFTRVTDDMVPELGVLTNLLTLKLKDYRVTSLAPFTSAVNPLRHDRGWPPVDASHETVVFPGRGRPRTPATNQL